MTQAITGQVLVPRTVHGVPSGTYDGSSLDWYSDPIKAANYYRSSSYSTAFINVEGFSGLITLQGTHDQNPDFFGTWTDIASYGDIDDITTYTDYHPIVILGNYAWIQARIQNFNSGIILAVTVNY